MSKFLERQNNKLKKGFSRFNLLNMEKFYLKRLSCFLYINWCVVQIRYLYIRAGNNEDNNSEIKTTTS